MSFLMRLYFGGNDARPSTSANPHPCVIDDTPEALAAARPMPLVGEPMTIDGL